MQKRTYLVLAILILYCLTIAAPAVAQDVPPLDDPEKRFDHSIIYDIGGRITIDRQLGHRCTTGAVKQTTVRGYGEMTKSEYVRMAANIITVNEDSAWTVPADALGNLRVTTDIQLCSRPMSAADAVYGDIAVDDIINVYDPLVVSGVLPVYGLTMQRWIASITTNPGHTGNYQSDFIAAYGPGPYEELYGVVDPYGNRVYYDEEQLWFYERGIHWSDRDDRRRGYDRGDYYVGNYFEIDQYAYTSGGEMRRLISMSNPFENTMLFEDMYVEGMASVRESFDMPILRPGPKAVTLAWYELF